MYVSNTEKYTSHTDLTVWGKPPILCCHIHPVFVCGVHS